MSEAAGIVIPTSIFWSMVISAVIGIGGAYALLLKTHWETSQKMSKTECLERHRPIDLEILAMSKDIEKLAEANGIKPHPRPSNGDDPPE